MSNPVLDVFPELEATWDDNLPLVENYQEILINKIPMIDLRAPCEFEQGAFPNAINLPLMNDEERHDIGVCYKQKGQKAAIKLGNQLVSGTKKAQRLKEWSDFINQNPNAMIYCFRGGMRSQISQMWLHEQGFNIKRIKGGYKSLRRFLIDTIEQQSEKQDFIVLSGLTGIGKTHFIKQYQKNLDLEDLANHKGSSFGHEITPQPKPINFENLVAIELLKKQNLKGNYLVEDEGNRVGILSVPIPLVKKLKESPIILLKASLESRINIIYQDYIGSLKQSAFRQLGKEKGYSFIGEYLLGALSRIKKRLGHARYNDIHRLLLSAVEENDDSKYCLAIEQLMVNYYDPMYRHQLSLKQDRIIFEGNSKEVSEYLKDKVY